MNKIKKNIKKKKIHRRYIPKLSCRIPRGIASKLIARVSNHNWHHNYDLINLRRKLGMRIHARSELCETLTILSSVLIAHCNYSVYSEYLFEIYVPFEIIAYSMNMLHIYENGRKSYDPPLHALRILEKLKYLIIFRQRNPDTGHCKPLRIWLTPRFFTSRGITIQEIRLSLMKLEKWVINKKLTSTYISYKNKHLIKMRVIGIDLIKYPSLRNLLLNIRKNILGKIFIEQIKNNIRSFYNNNNNNNNKNKNGKLFNKIEKNKPSNFWYCKFIN